MRGVKVAGATLGLSVVLSGAAVGLAGPASAAPCPGGYPANQCTIAIDDSRVVVGQEVGFRATGYTPGEQARATVFSTPVVVGTYTANASGVVNGTFTVPNVNKGRHTLTVVGLTSGIENSVRFNVVPNAKAAGNNSNGSSDSDSLAFTGSDTFKTAGVGALLLVGGGALIMASKRRKHVNAAI
jgi:hypothetical protein